MKFQEYIDSLAQFKSPGGYKPGLKRIEYGLKRLGNPERQLKIIHVAGTNGKGSTSAIIASILRAAGYKTGLYTSPHLAHYRERFRINGVPINDQDLERLTEQIKPVMDEMEFIPELGKPSFFEVITIIALCYFAEEKVDALVLEVGLGGRLDATNVAHPLASVITTIGFDHMEYLGNTLAEIAQEKAGIIKDGVPVIIGVEEEEAYLAIQEIASQRNAPLYRPVRQAQWHRCNSGLHRQTLDITIGSKTYPGIQLALVGEHQIRNAIVAIQTMEVVQVHFPRIDENAIYAGLSKVRWPGRLEVVKDKPAILLDGAHNIEGIEALSTFLEEVKGHYRHLYLIMSILRDKDVTLMVRRIAPLATSIVFTQNTNKRASDATDLAEVVQNANIPAEVIADMRQAIGSTIARATQDDLICICGSLYTIAEARQILIDDHQGTI